MSGPGVPSYLDPPQRMREIRLQSAVPLCADVKPRERYVMTIWGRSCPAGWTGWFSKDRVISDPIVVWQSTYWEEVP